MFNKIKSLFTKKESTVEGNITIVSDLRYKHGVNQRVNAMTQSTARVVKFAQLDGVKRPIVRATHTRTYKVRNIIEAAFRSLPPFKANADTLREDVIEVLKSPTIKNAVNLATMSTGVDPKLVGRFVQNAAARYATA